LVSVIIPSFDRFDRLMACVESVMAADPQPSGGLQAVVVTSTYDFKELREIENAGATVLRLAHRLLVSASRNAGANVARGDYLLFLDDDNILGKEAIWRLWRALHRWPDAVLVGPVMYYGSEPERIWCAGVHRSAIFMKTKLRSDLPHPVPERLSSEDFPNCFMVRRDDFDGIGGFDVSRFPQHMEEADLARRLVRVTGKQVFCVPHAELWHFIGTRFLRRLHTNNEERSYWNARGRALFVATYGNRKQWLIYVAVGQWALAVVHLWAMFTEPAHGRAALAIAYLRGMITGLRVGVALRASDWEHITPSAPRA
jgi:GT2 family glycosyltransferase